jgi:putative membrane protein
MRNPRAVAWLAATLGPGTAAHAQAQGYEYGPGMMGAYGWAHGSAFGMVGMVLWWVLIILGIALLARWLIKGAPGSGDAPRSRALAILEERYARGEIDKQQFEDMKRDLGP